MDAPANYRTGLDQPLTADLNAEPFLSDYAAATDNGPEDQPDTTAAHGEASVDSANALEGFGAENEMAFGDFDTGEAHQYNDQTAGPTTDGGSEEFSFGGGTIAPETQEVPQDAIPEERVDSIESDPGAALLDAEPLAGGAESSPFANRGTEEVSSSTRQESVPAPPQADEATEDHGLPVVEGGLTSESPSEDAVGFFGGGAFDVPADDVPADVDPAAESPTHNAETPSEPSTPWTDGFVEEIDEAVAGAIDENRADDHPPGSGWETGSSQWAGESSDETANAYSEVTDATPTSRPFEAEVDTVEERASATQTESNLSELPSWWSEEEKDSDQESHSSASDAVVSTPFDDIDEAVNEPANEHNFFNFDEQPSSAEGHNRDEAFPTAAADQINPSHGVSDGVSAPFDANAGDEVTSQEPAESTEQALQHEVGEMFFGAEHLPQEQPSLAESAITASDQESLDGTASPEEALDAGASDLVMSIQDDEALQDEAQEDDSVEDYMRKLLARMRGVPEDEVEMPAASATSPPPAPRTTAPSPPPLPVPESAQAEIPQADPRVPEEPAPAETDDPDATTPFDPEQYVPKVLAPEKVKNLAAMRELANSSARTAIHKSTQQRHLTGVLLKGTISGVGLIVGGILLVINGLAVNIGLIATGAAFLVAAIWGYDAATSLRPLLPSELVLKPTAPAISDDEDEDGADSDPE